MDTDTAEGRAELRAFLTEMLQNPISPQHAENLRHDLKVLSEGWTPPEPPTSLG